MIVLPTTTKLQVVLGDAAATEMDFVASYIDTTADVVGQNNGVTNDTTDVDMVAAPAAGQRLVRYVSIYNADSATHDVTVKTDASATERILVKQSLDAGQTLVYDSQAGWYLAFDGAATGVAASYDTLYVDAAAMIPCTTDGAEAGTNEYGTNDIDVDYLAFDTGATEERAQFKLVMPESWDRSTVKVKFFWSSATGSSIADTVEWGIKAGALSDDDAIDAALGTPVTVSDAVLANDGADLQLTAATAALTVGGTPALDDLIPFEVYRNTDGTDDMAEDAWLFGVLVQYKKTNVVSEW